MSALLNSNLDTHIYEKKKEEKENEHQKIVVVVAAGRSPIDAVPLHSPNGHVFLHLSTETDKTISIPATSSIQYACHSILLRFIRLLAFLAQLSIVTLSSTDTSRRRRRRLAFFTRHFFSNLGNS